MWCLPTKLMVVQMSRPTRLIDIIGPISPRYRLSKGPCRLIWGHHLPEHSGGILTTFTVKPITC